MTAALVLTIGWVSAIVLFVALTHAHEARLRNMEGDHTPDSNSDWHGAGGGEVRFIHTQIDTRKGL